MIKVRKPTALGGSSAGWGLLAIALAATLWSIAAVVARKLFDAGVTPFQLATARAVVAALGLGLLTRGGGSGKLITRQMLGLGLSLALVTACYYVAIARLSVAVALVIQYTGPALVVLFNILRSRRLPNRSVMLALLAALTGVSLVAGVFADRLSLNAVGLLAAGLSALFFASYTLLSEALVDRYGAMGVMFRGFLVSSLFWVAFQTTQGWPQALFLPTHVPGILFVGVGGTLVPFCLMCWGIQQVSAERGAIAATLEPVIAAVLAWLWLGQGLTPAQILGSALVLGAVLLLQIRIPVSPN